MATDTERLDWLIADSTIPGSITDDGGDVFLLIGDILTVTLGGQTTRWIATTACMIRRGDFASIERAYEDGCLVVAPPFVPRPRRWWQIWRDWEDKARRL